MPLSEFALNEIRVELAELHRLDVRVAERIKALEAILTPFDFSQFGTSFQGHAAPNGTEIAQPEQRPVDPIATMSLRPAILAVLKEIGPARAPKVAETLAARGYPTEGKTRFSTRVYNDLWRMATNDVIDSINGEFQVK